MDFINRKTVVTYRYDNKREMEFHAKRMQREGWMVEVEFKHSFFKSSLTQSYYKNAKQGAYL